MIIIAICVSSIVSDSKFAHASIIPSRTHSGRIAILSMLLVVFKFFAILIFLTFVSKTCPGIGLRFCGPRISH